MTTQLSRRSLPPQWIQFIAGLLLAIIGFFAQQTFQSQKNVESSLNNLTLLVATMKAENAAQIGKINEIERRVQKIEGDVYFYNRVDNTRVENAPRLK